MITNRNSIVYPIQKIVSNMENRFQNLINNLQIELQLIKNK